MTGLRCVDESEKARGTASCSFFCCCLSASSARREADHAETAARDSVTKDAAAAHRSCAEWKAIQQSHFEHAAHWWIQTCLAVSSEWFYLDLLPATRGLYVDLGLGVDVVQ